jgi:hypothetical protein
MRIDFRIVKCECGEIHIPARDGEPCGQCRYEARKFFVPPKETEHVPDEVPLGHAKLPLEQSSSA